MIPYALLMFKIIWEDESLDVRALDLNENGFTFRVSSSRISSLKRPGIYQVSFFDSENICYKRIRVEGNIEILKDGYASFSSSDPAFIEDIELLRRDYLHMIDVKLNNDEIDSMEILINHTLDKEFCSGRKEFLDSFLKPVRQTNSLLPVEIGIVIDNQYLYDTFLNLTKNDFIREYWKYNNLIDFDIIHQEISHVYIGNQFCSRLFPKERDLLKIINRVFEYGLNPVITFSILHEKDISLFTSIILSLSKINTIRPIELILNDYGEALIIKELVKNKIIDEGAFVLTTGVLLNKRKKDPRIIGMTKMKQVLSGNKDNMFNDEKIVDFLENKLGFTNFSFEGCGYEIVPPIENGILHLPTYETNTSDCVLYQIEKYNKRGIYSDTSDCAFYCENKTIFYPKNEALIGIGNTIFGISDFEINNFDYLNSLINRGVKRIVIRTI